MLQIKPLHDSYQKDVTTILWEPLNIFWAECYEACKLSTQNRSKHQMESRRRFQQKILVPWRSRQTEELTRLNGLLTSQRINDCLIERQWKSAKRFLHGERGTWHYE